MKRESINSVIKGADKLFVVVEEGLPIEGTDPQQGTAPTPELQPVTETDTVAGMEVGTDVGTDTVLQSMLKPSEDYVRKVYYPLTKQDAFIKKKAKKYKVSESEIVRIMLDYFMKNGKI